MAAGVGEYMTALHKPRLISTQAAIGVTSPEPSLRLRHNFQPRRYGALKNLADRLFPFQLLLEGYPTGGRFVFWRQFLLIRRAY